MHLLTASGTLPLLEKTPSPDFGRCPQSLVLQLCQKKQASGDWCVCILCFKGGDTRASALMASRVSQNRGLLPSKFILDLGHIYHRSRASTHSTLFPSPDHLLRRVRLSSLPPIWLALMRSSLFPSSDLACCSGVRGGVRPAGTHP
jgi:hypothetical protein